MGKVTSAAQIAGRLGALKRNHLYGNPGTVDSRRKGGFVSYFKLLLNSELAANSRFILEKKINIPNKSSELSEFIGIVLGDGSISSDYQVRIYFNAKTDAQYANFVRDLVF